MIIFSSLEPSGCDTETRFDCLQDGTHCIPLDMVCDGHEDCRNGEDESDPSCEINSSELAILSQLSTKFY